MTTMPTIRVGPYRLYSSRTTAVRPRHTHADGENCIPKFWLDLDASLVTNDGYSRREVRSIERIVRDKLEFLRNERDEFCSGYFS